MPVRFVRRTVAYPVLVEVNFSNQARELLDSIAIARNTARDGSAETDEPALIGLRDRALIGVIANHESPRTTKLYDRRQDEISLDKVERIAI